MNTITLTEVLEYYDGIQMFAGRDTTGVHYVCDMIETEGDFDSYAVVAVCPKRLNDFRTGQVDLRTLLLESTGAKWYIAVAKGTIDQPLELLLLSEPLADSSHLPEAGYFLRPAETHQREKTRNTAGDHNKENVQLATMNPN